MGRLKNLDAIETIGGGSTPSIDTASYEVTPVPDTNYYQDNTPSPWSDNYNTNSTTPAANDSYDSNDRAGQAALEQASAESQAPAQPVEPAQPQNEYTQQALQDVVGAQADPVTSMQRDGIDADTQTKLAQANSLIASGNATLDDLEKNYSSYYGLYMKYYGQPAQQQPTTTAPATPAQQTLIDSSAQSQSAGTYIDPKKYYDPSLKYGRQENGGYVYSNSAAQLQSNLAREGYYKGAIDGYFGQQTQEALDAYLSEHGIKTEPEPDKGAATLADAIQETPSNVEQALKNYATSIRPESSAVPDSLPSAGQVYGMPQTTSPSSGRHYEGVGNKAQNPDKVSQEEAITGTAPVYGTPRYGGITERPTWDNFNDLAMQQQLMELQREWDANEAMQNGQNNEPTAPEYTIYDEPIGPTMPEPTGVYGTPGNRGIPNRYQAEIEQIQEPQGQVYGTPRNGSVPERYIAPEESLQGTAPVYGSPRYGGVPERVTWDNYNDVAMNQQLAELEREWNANNAREANGEVYGMPRNGSVPERYTAPQEETPVGTAPVYGSPRYGGVTERANWDNYNDIAMMLELDELQREWGNNTATGEVYGSTRNGSVPERYMSPQERTFSPETVAPDDIQSSGEVYGTPRNGSIPERYTEPNTGTTQNNRRPEGVSQVGDSMSRALADNQAKPTTNIFAQDAPPVVSPEREQQYKTLFNNEITALRQMYPDASFNQLYDYLRLFYAQNGDTDTEYYRWFNSFL